MPMSTVVGITNSIDIPTTFTYKIMVVDKISTIHFLTYLQFTFITSVTTIVLKMQL